MTLITNINNKIANLKYNYRSMSNILEYNKKYKPNTLANNGK